MSSGRLLVRYITASGLAVLLLLFVHVNRTQEDTGRCFPAKKIVFMKTHKCASSTIENILFRHAHREDLNVVIPAEGSYLSKTELFNRSILMDTPWAGLEMDLFTLHNRWNYEEVVALMGQDIRTFTILRDPVDLFESLYTYYRMNETYNTNLKGFIRLLREDGQPNNQSGGDILQLRNRDRFGRNQMAWDLGLSPSMFDDVQAVDQLISRLEEQFDLVLLSDRMDESLILLRHLLCWPIDALTHLDRNVRKRELTVKLDSEERKVLKKWLSVDEKIYSHFARLFDAKVSRYPHMADEVQLLSEANRNLRKRCVMKRVGNEELSGGFHEWHNGTMGYLINEKEPGCDLLAFSEMKYLDIFRERMTKRASTRLSKQ